MIRYYRSKWSELHHIEQAACYWAIKDHPGYLNLKQKLIDTLPPGKRGKNRGWTSYGQALEALMSRKEFYGDDGINVDHWLSLYENILRPKTAPVSSQARWP